MTQSKSKRKSTIGIGLKDVIGVDEPIDRSMIQGWNVDEVASLMAKGKPTEKDLERAVERIVEINNVRASIEISSKREEYLWMAYVYTNRERLFIDMYGEKDGERYIRYFPQFLIDKCDIPWSTAYKDAKVVWYLIEWKMIEILANDELYKDYEERFGKLILKFRTLAYKSDEIKALYQKDHKLLGRSVEEIQAEGLPKKRAKWKPTGYKSGVSVMALRSGERKVKIEDKKLQNDFDLIMKKCFGSRNRETLDKVLEILKK